jgi:hypothetical protein
MKSKLNNSRGKKREKAKQEAINRVKKYRMTRDMQKAMDKRKAVEKHEQKYNLMASVMKGKELSEM